MSFGCELSNEFNKYTNGVFYNEVQLCTKIQDALANMKYNSKFSMAIDIIHRSKSFVEFKHDAKYITNPPAGDNKTRELSDMLFVVFKQQEIRLMYMQNKKGDNSAKFTADLLQLHLLRERKEILSTPLSPCVFGNSEILSKAVLPSVGSYGIFYQENTGKIEMAYYSAKRIKLCNDTRCATRKVYYDAQLFGKVEIDAVSGYKESQGERTLEDFGNALVDMRIGTPILQKKPAMRDLTQFLYLNSNVFQTAFQHLDLPGERQIESFGQMSFICVINTDLMAKISG